MTTRFRERSVTDMKSILLADESHAPLIAALEACTFSHPQSEKSLVEFFKSERNFAVVCLENRELVSYCTLTSVLDEAQIINVATAVEYKRQGCAKAIFERIFEECMRKGIISISLEVREGNLPAIALYEGLGFYIAGKRKNFYTDPRENALIMIKNLD